MHQVTGQCLPGQGDLSDCATRSHGPVSIKLIKRHLRLRNQARLALAAYLHQKGTTHMGGKRARMTDR